MPTPKSSGSKNSSAPKRTSRQQYEYYPSSEEEEEEADGLIPTKMPTPPGMLPWPCSNPPDDPRPDSRIDPEGYVRWRDRRLAAIIEVEKQRAAVREAREKKEKEEKERAEKEKKDKEKEERLQNQETDKVVDSNGVILNKEVVDGFAIGKSLDGSDGATSITAIGDKVHVPPDKPNLQALPPLANMNQVVSVGRFMFQEDMPIDYGSIPTALAKKLKESIEDDLFKDCKFFHDEDAIDAVVGYIMYRCGLGGAGEMDRQKHAQMWIAFRNTIGKRTDGIRQLVYDRWYKVAEGKSKLVLCLVSTSIVLFQLYICFLRRIFTLEEVWISENKSLPDPNMILSIYKQLWIRESFFLHEDEKKVIFWFMNCVMPCVQKFWVGCKTGSYYSKVTTTDEAFGLFIIKCYSQLPSKGERKDKIAGQTKEQGIKWYGEHVQYLKSIRAMKSNRIKHPMLSIDNDMRDYFAQPVDIGDIGNRKIAKKRKVQKQSEEDVKVDSSVYNDYTSLFGLTEEPKYITGL
jgi:hypothetical protein